MTAHGNQKAKDWDVLELFYKMDRVEDEKVHASKLGRGQGSMYGEDRLMLHWSYSVAAHVPIGGVYTTTPTEYQGVRTRR